MKINTKKLLQKYNERKQNARKLLIKKIGENMKINTKNQEVEQISASKFKGQYTCGHEGIITGIYGKTNERMGKAEYIFSTNQCPECQKKAQEAHIEKKAKEAKEASENMPKLKGSEKQVKWANQIRLEKIKEIKEDMKINLTDMTEENLNWMIQNITSASWYIDVRGKDADEIDRKVQQVKENPAKYKRQYSR